MFADWLARSGRCLFQCRVAQLVEQNETEAKAKGVSLSRRFESDHGNKHYYKLKIVKVMEQTNIQRDIDREEIKRIWQQLAIGTALALAGLVFMGIGEAICRWLEGM